MRKIDALRALRDLGEIDTMYALRKADTLYDLRRISISLWRDIRRMCREKDESLAEYRLREKMGR